MEERLNTQSEVPPFTQRLVTPIMDAFGLSRGVALFAVGLAAFIMAFGVFWFFYSAPPKTITITSGTEGSSFQTNAEKYARILARKGVTLKIVPSEGSLENLHRLENPSIGVDVGFVQGGITNDGTNHLPSGPLVSLGSISYEPLFVFYRGHAAVTRLSQLAGQRVAIGPVGSGTRSLALTLLDLNGLHPGGPTTFVDLDADAAANALLAGTVDAVFLMGDSASSQILRQLLHAPSIQLLDFVQADAYTRKISYLNKLELPEGSINFGKDIPTNTVHLIGPTVELLARPDLNPALSDLLLEAAQEVHGPASLLKRRGEFPAPLEHDFPISPAAAHYYKSGKTFLYSHLPFRLASLVSPILVAIVPMIVLLIPTLRILPAIYRWRIRLRIYRRYRALLAFERELVGKVTPARQKDLLLQLDKMEDEVNKMKVSAPFADQFYGLRGDIAFVRQRIQARPPTPGGAAT